MNVQQVFKSTLNAVINEDYSISADIDNYHNILKRALFFDVVRLHLLKNWASLKFHVYFIR